MNREELERALRTISITLIMKYGFKPVRVFDSLFVGGFEWLSKNTFWKANTAEWNFSIILPSALFTTDCLDLSLRYGFVFYRPRINICLRPLDIGHIINTDGSLLYEKEDGFECYEIQLLEPKSVINKINSIAEAKGDCNDRVGRQNESLNVRRRLHKCSQ